MVHVSRIGHSCVCCWFELGGISLGWDGMEWDGDFVGGNGCGVLLVWDAMSGGMWNWIWFGGGCILLGGNAKGRDWRVRLGGEEVDGVNCR